jgi:hypothetical protein
VKAPAKIRKKKKHVFLQSSSHWLVFHGQKGKFLEVEIKFSSYLNEMQKLGYVVSSEICQLKATEIIKKIGIQCFNASQGWLQKIFKQNNFCVR